MGTRRASRLTGLAVVLASVSGLLGSAVGATTPPRTSTLSLTYGAQTPSTTTSMRLQIVYRKPSEPNGKPSPIRHLVIQTPPGTTFHLGQVPACTATDEELETVGRAACPSDNQVATGTISIISGLGPPVDPFVGDDVLYNDGQGWVETVTDRGTSYPVLGTDRGVVTGSKVTDNPPFVPGPPPDGSAVRSVDFTYPASTGYITTPPQCPPSRLWTTYAQFGFADGTTQAATSTTPCLASPRRGP